MIQFLTVVDSLCNTPLWPNRSRVLFISTLYSYVRFATTTSGRITKINHWQINSKCKILRSYQTRQEIRNQKLEKLVQRIKALIWFWVDSMKFYKQCVHCHVMYTRQTTVYPKAAKRSIPCAPLLSLNGSRHRSSRTPCNKRKYVVVRAYWKYLWKNLWPRFFYTNEFLRGQLMMYKLSPL